MRGRTGCVCVCWSWLTGWALASLVCCVHKFVWIASCISSAQVFRDKTEKALAGIRSETGARLNLLRTDAKRHLCPVVVAGPRAAVGRAREMLRKVLYWGCAGVCLGRRRGGREVGGWAAAAGAPVGTYPVPWLPGAVMRVVVVVGC